MPSQPIATSQIASVNRAGPSRHRLWARPARRIARGRSAILGYHGVARSPLREDLSFLQVRPTRFRAQLETMLDAGFEFVTVAQLVRLANGGEPPPGFAAVSFDDGMLNNLTTAQPIMSEYDIPGTVYVTVGYIAGRSPWVQSTADNQMMDETNLRAIADAGWEIGAHTMTHADLSRLPYEECRREIEQSKHRLEEMLDIPVETFAYPFGHRSATAVRAARDSKLLGAVSTGQGSWDAFELKRAMIGALDPMPIVLIKLADRYEPLLRSPPVDLLRKASKWMRARAQSEGVRVEQERAEQALHQPGQDEPTRAEQPQA
jgi:peptidoglycan/xylan/chitin deacetylase (PgdA/CDA1 family)